MTPSDLDVRDAEASIATAMKAKDWNAAVPLLERQLASEEPRPTVRTLVRLIQGYRAQGRFLETESVSRRAVELFPEDERVWSQLAYNAKTAKDFTAAATRLEKLYALSAGRVAEKTYVRLAEAFRRAHRRPEAERFIREGLERFPGSTGLLSQSARIHEHADEWESAAGVLARLIAAEGGVGSAANSKRYATALRNSGNRSGAAAFLERISTLHADDEELHEVRNDVAGAGEQATNETFVDDWIARLDDGRTRRHPYQNLRPYQFWNSAVENRYALDVDQWYRRKFSISGRSMATAGSCFAQHIGRHLRSNGYQVLDVEPAPVFLKQSSWLDFGFGMYSARYGNLYTSRQLLQLVRRAAGDFEPVDQVWVKGNGFVDPFRPTIEPEPFVSEDELLSSRRAHLQAVTQLLKQAGVFIFTLGLTETWRSKLDGAVFPVAPGVSGGTWDPDRYEFHNLDHGEVLSDMEEFIERARAVNPGLKFIFTVSPVPLMATASDAHVVAATTYSKSVLRSVAGKLAAQHDFVDYFPSFEIISSHVMRGQFYNPDMRTVANAGVEHVMRQFFAEHRPSVQVPRPGKGPVDDEEVVCDEELLRTFGAVHK